jgi:hypothetical protein
MGGGGLSTIDTVQGKKGWHDTKGVNTVPGRMLFLMERNPVGGPKRHRDVVRIMRRWSSAQREKKKKNQNHKVE